MPGLGGAQRTDVQNARPGGSQVEKKPVIKPLTPAGKTRIYTNRHVLPEPAAGTRYYDVVHAFDSFGSLYFNNASEVDFGENLAKFQSGSGYLQSFFKPIAVRKKHLVIFTLYVWSSTTVQLQAGAEDNSWNAPNETVPLHFGTNYVSMVFQPKNNVPVTVFVNAGNAFFFFESESVELVKPKP